MKKWDGKCDLSDILPKELLSVDLIQLLCEGGCLKSALANKTTFSQQVGNSKTIDILSGMAAVISALSKIEDCPALNIVTCKLLKTIVKVTQVNFIILCE